MNVLIGPNGAGKSNLISFFKLLNEMIERRLQLYISKEGQGHSFLYYGPKVTPQIEAQLEFEMDGGLYPRCSYELCVSHAAGDVLVFAVETLGSEPIGGIPSAVRVSIGTGQQETRIVDEANRGDETAKVLRGLLTNCRVYHFHDTSATARVRQSGYIGDNRLLLPDAGNLAAVLYRLKNQDRGVAYQRIVSTIRMIAPFFQDFALEPASPNAHDVILNWMEKDADQIFGPHQFSDGTLRCICLVTLLLQPESELPRLIVVDEPELGLHPYALNVIASLFGKASHHAQLLVSTQSTAFLDNFDPEDVIVVDRHGKESVFARPDPSSLEAWLQEYSLGEVWEKNVIGGGPH